MKILLLTLLLVCTSCSALNDIQKALPPTAEEVAMGLREALSQGTDKGSAQASAIDGYFGNALLKILFPPEVSQVENTLRNVGLGNLVDKFVLSMNRAAEAAATEAKPIFLSAIRSMTIQDAWAILRGDKNAATQYLRRTTSQALTDAFRPVIQSALNKVSATKYYDDVINAYNKIPGVTRVNPDLTSYVTQRAIDGLFVLIEQEEKNIRENPVARTTEIMRKVFGYQG